MKTIIIKNLQNTQRLIPHTLQSFQSILIYWNKKYDRTKKSLIDKSHKPHSKYRIIIQRVSKS